DRQRPRECGSGGPELMVAFLQHLPQARRRCLVPGFFELVGKESGIVTDLVYIKTKGTVHDTEQLAHETHFLLHETNMAVYETIVKYIETLSACRETGGDVFLAFSVS